jgi:hypothetical protein
MKKNTLCRFDFGTMPIEFHRKFPFTEKDTFVYLGDIVQMPGHCIVVDNQIFTCYHTDEFVEIPEEEC